MENVRSHGDVDMQYKAIIPLYGINSNTNYWFMQNVSIPHQIQQTFDFLAAHYDNKVFSFYSKK